MGLFGRLFGKGGDASSEASGGIDLSGMTLTAHGPCGYLKDDAGVVRAFWVREEGDAAPDG